MEITEYFALEEERGQSWALVAESLASTSGILQYFEVFCSIVQYFAVEEREELGSGCREFGKQRLSISCRDVQPTVCNSTQLCTALVEIYTKFSDWNTITVQQCFVE